MDKDQSVLVCFGRSKNSNNGGRQKRWEKKKEGEQRGKGGGKDKYLSTSLGKLFEVMEEPHKWRWLSFTLFREEESLSLKTRERCISIV
jgi:hypothetical protein